MNIGRIIVHIKLDKNDIAPCGYKFQKHLRGLDYVKTWNYRVATPINCEDCKRYEPKKYKIPSWQGVGRKAKL